MGEVVLNHIIETKLNEFKVLELLHESLQIKLKLLNVGKADKNEYDINELFIEEFSTQFKILKLNSVIEEKQKDIDETFKIYIQELEEQCKK